MKPRHEPKLAPFWFWLLSTALLGAVPASAQNYRDHFAEGMAARERENWDEAFDKARLAISERASAEARRVEIEGFGPLPYTPYLLLGIAAHHRADCKITTQAYVAAVAQRVAPVLVPADFARLREGREACAAAGDAAQLAAADAVAGALVAYSRTNALRSGDMQAHWDSDARWQQDFDEATRGLEFGHNLLVLSLQGTGAPEDLQSAVAVVQRSQTQFRALDNSVGDAAIRQANTAISNGLDRSDEVDARRQTSGDSWTADLDSDAAGAKLRLEEAEATLGQAVGRQRTARALGAASLAAEAETTLNAVLGAAESLAPAASSQPTTDVARAAPEPSREPATPTEPDRAPSRTEPGSEPTEVAQKATPDRASAPGQATEAEPREPDTALRAGAAAYFRGDYQATLEALGEATGSQSARLQAHLLRAAAGFSLSRLEQSEQRLEEARAEIGALLELDGSFRPPAAYFPPEFLLLFER